MSLEPPDYLDGLAREEWYRVLPVLQRTGWFDLDLDQVMLAGYCAMVGHAIAAQQLLAERGLVYTAPDGTEKADPIVECVVDAWNAVLNAAIVALMRARVIPQHRVAAIIDHYGSTVKLERA